MTLRLLYVSATKDPTTNYTHYYSIWFLFNSTLLM
jgi:hypothetical protein